ncbi:MAG: SoxR reducing system RseC family protein [Planctomycetota bacterium]
MPARATGSRSWRRNSTTFGAEPRSTTLVKEERARVVAVDRGKATVELDQSDHCRSCGLCVSAAGRKMSLVVDAIDGLGPGRTVVVAIDRSASFASVFFLFGLPLAGLIAGALIGYSFPVFGMTPDASAAVLGIGFLVAAFFVALLYDRKFAAKRIPSPTIVRIEPE